MIWTTQDGRKMPISKMSFTHLYNAIRMVLKNAAEELEAMGVTPDGDLFNMDSPCLFPGEEISLSDFLSDKAIGLIKEYQRRVAKAGFTAKQRRALRIDDAEIMKLRFKEK